MSMSSAVPDLNWVYPSSFIFWITCNSFGLNLRVKGVLLNFVA